MNWQDAFASGNDERAETAAKLLVQGGPNSLPILESLSAHPDANIRWWAVRSLGEINVPECGRLLAGHLLDEDVAVRQCAAVGLRHHPTVEAVPTLLALLDASDGLEGRLAGDALIAVGAAAVEGLLDVMSKGKTAARQQAARCLAKIGDLRAIPAFFEALDDESAWVRHWADEGLERMGVGMVFFKP